MFRAEVGDHSAVTHGRLGSRLHRTGRIFLLGDAAHVTPPVRVRRQHRHPGRLEPHEFPCVVDCGAGPRDFIVDHTDNTPAPLVQPLSLFSRDEMWMPDGRG
ncbi:FAD-dependent monooxygenase [Nocardia sp. CA-107356]|uniref:FAD-dependent monooxygenase n=1 Tax=Nocardia sp. CA-107356 TaxID=3239972 RepID=UPI003D9456A9